MDRPSSLRRATNNDARGSSPVPRHESTHSDGRRRVLGLVRRGAGSASRKDAARAAVVFTAVAIPTRCSEAVQC